PLGALPDVIVDGYVDPAKLVDGAVPEELRICVQNGEAEVLDVDGPNDNAKPRLATAEHDCALAPLAPVVLANGLGE
ncbi:MAG: hypothetical protein KDA48_05890, partial [Amphiplicatus sp.]|nr:hypothetical protein [Amphiplicatus sp.]